MKMRIHGFLIVISLLISAGQLSGATGVITSIDFTIDNRHTLTTSSGHGGVVTAPGEGSYLYARAANPVSVVALAEADYEFSTWTGSAVTAGKVANRRSASTTVTMDDNYTLAASFVPHEIRSLQIESVEVLDHEITSTSAILRGRILDDAGTADCWTSFRYFKSSESFAYNVRTEEHALTTVNGQGDFSQLIEGLDPNCTYRYQALARNATGIDVGQYRAFTTSADPEVDPNGLYLYVDAKAVESPAQDGNGHAPFATIQQAIDVAESGQTVVVLPGLYVESLNFKGKAISVTSLALADSNALGPFEDVSCLGAIDRTIIHGNYEGPAVVFESGEDANTGLTGFTITGGLGRYGGGILCYGSSPTVSHCIITGNRAAWVGGGAVDSFQSAMSLINCTISDNYSHDEYGAAMTCEDSNDVLTNCIVWGNHPDQIVVVSGHSPSIQYSDIEGHVWPGTGNISEDPHFALPGWWVDAEDANMPVDASVSDAHWVLGDVHLQSVSGRFDPNQADWIVDMNTSPCIDLGDPNGLFTLESDPNGLRLNAGAYGGTLDASRSEPDSTDLDQ